MITRVSETSVSILEIRDGQNWRKVYENSEPGRSELSAEYPVIFADITGSGSPWGTEPTVAPFVISMPLAPSLEERVANLEQTVDTVLTGGDAT